MVLFSLIAFSFALYNFFSLSSPISYTGGAELVVLTSFTITLFSIMLTFFKHRSWRKNFVDIFLLILIIGTTFAGWLLEAWLFFDVMLVVFVGWIIQVCIPGRK